MDTSSRTGWILASLIALDPSAYLASQIEVTPRAADVPSFRSLEFEDVAVQPLDLEREENEKNSARPECPFAPRPSMVMPAAGNDGEDFPCCVSGSPFQTLFSMPLED